MEGIADGIDEIETADEGNMTDTTPAEVYDLTGRKTTVTKGVSIVNGKKVMMK